MYYDFKVEIPKDTGKICLKKIKDAIYVNYEYDRIYIKEKQYTNAKRTTIGRVASDDKTLMYPNPKFFEFFPDEVAKLDEEQNDRSSCLRIGTFLVLEKLANESGLKNILMKMYDEKGIGLFLDLASFLITTESNVMQYYPDYAYNHPLFTPNQKIYSDSTVSRLLSEIKDEDSVLFQNEWNRTKNHEEKIYISYDSTNKHAKIGEISLAELGHSKDGREDPIVNISIAYDTDNKEPLFYEEYPGSIVDVSQLTYMLKKASDYGYKKAAFILDRGYFSKANLHFMDKEGYAFVIMVKGMMPLVKEVVKKVKNTFEEKRTSYIQRYQIYGTTVKRKLFDTDEKERYIHIFYNAQKAASEKSNFEDKIDTMANLLKKVQGTEYILDKTYQNYFIPEYYEDKENSIPKTIFFGAREKNDVIDESLSLCGYFCIVTSEDMTAKEAIEIYKSRDYSEKLFAMDKRFLGSKSMRVYDTISFKGKLLVEFAALILRNRMYIKLKDEYERINERPNFMNAPASIRELEKIEMIKGPTGIYRLSHALTANQKVILKSFGIDTRYVQKRANEISETLNPKIKTIQIKK